MSYLKNKFLLFFVNVIVSFTACIPVTFAYDQEVYYTGQAKNTGAQNIYQTDIRDNDFNEIKNLSTEIESIVDNIQKAQNDFLNVLKNDFNDIDSKEDLINKFDKNDQQINSHQERMTKIENTQQYIEGIIKKITTRQHEMGNEYRTAYTSGYESARFNIWNQIINSAQSSTPSENANTVSNPVNTTLTNLINQQQSERITQPQKGSKDLIKHINKILNCTQTGGFFGYWTSDGKFKLVSNPDQNIRCQKGYCSCEKIL